MNDNATPRPWKVTWNAYGDEWWFGGDRGRGECVVRGPCAVEMVCGGRLLPHIEEMVRQLNSHDALVAACEAALPKLSEADDYAGNLIRDALRLARGEA